MDIHFRLVDRDLAEITLNDGKVNALSQSLLAEMAAVFDSLDSSPARVIVLRAAPGACVFSAGHDVHELPTDGRDPLTYDHPLRKAIRKIEHSPRPVVAMVEGSVWGGACELVLSCDLVIAAENATFAFTPARLGIPYDLQGAMNLRNAIGVHRLKELLFTAEPVPAPRLHTAGIINHIVPAVGLESFTRELAARIAQNSPLVHRLLKEEIRALAKAHPLDPETQERLQVLRREVYTSNDYREGIRAFLEKRSPEFHGN